MEDGLIRDEDLDFLLWEWLAVEKVLVGDAYSDHDRDTCTDLLRLSKQLAGDSFLSHYKDADRQEPAITADGDVAVLPAAAEAVRQYAELGLIGTGFDEAAGGSGFPAVIAAASMAQFMAANLATSAYAMLTVANARLLTVFGTPEQADAFATPMLEGGVLGTMCLSEPQAGSGLGEVRTKAQSDGASSFGPRYRLTGNKMWISGGDHDITPSINHLVLAKIPDEDGQLPTGTKGISLFVVPKILPDGARNDVVAAGLNHKMGYRGTVNCVLNFGEGRYEPDGQPGAVGFLVGEPGQGLAQMFQMMNEARIQVGLGAAAVAYRGYRLSVSYAADRRQGRSMTPGGDGEPAPIADHPDVQRMLLAQKCYAEGALALVLYCAKLVDEAERGGGGAEEANELLSLLTPVAKTWPSEWGLAANDLAIQVHGGYGYTRDYDVEQLYRDNRLNPIHEGTTGIQALDLLGRKVLRGDGRGMAILRGRITETASRADMHPDLGSFGAALNESWEAVQRTVSGLDRDGEARATLGHAGSFLSAFGHVVVGWLWLDQAVIAAAAASNPLRAGKARACRYFFRFELPRVHHWLSIVDSQDDVTTTAPLEQF